jgi:predicted ATPase
MPQLVEVRLNPPEGDVAFPFDVPALAALSQLDLDCPVALFVGDNGTGKSTLMEALAVATGLPTVGSGMAGRDPTLEAQARLARNLRLVWRGRTHRGFFLRAEDFFGFQKNLVRQRADHRTEIARLEEELKGHSPLARMLAVGPHRGSIADMERRYGENPDARSHGEAFLGLFQSRLVPGGLFLMDEPEAALSPQSQLGFLAMIRQAIEDWGQFVIATHSPILMAIPGARIFSFDGGAVRQVSFDELESVALVRDFLQAPERFLRHVWK